MIKSGQYPLPLTTSPQASLESYFPGGNEELLKMLKAFPGSDGAGVVYLHGAPGCGKTHLLTAMLAGMSAREGRYVSLADPDLSVDMLRGLVASSLIVVDDLENLSGRRPWQDALFGLFEQCKATDAKMLLAASVPPAGLQLELKDLASRLASAVVYRVNELVDAQRSSALKWAAHQRGLDLSDETCEWVLRRIPRDNRSLFKLLERIDRAALTSGARVTIPFLKQADLL